MGAVDKDYAKRFFEDDPGLRDRFYVKPEPIEPMPPIAGPNSVAHKYMPPSLRHALARVDLRDNSVWVRNGTFAEE